MFQMRKLLDIWCFNDDKTDMEDKICNTDPVALN